MVVVKMEIHHKETAYNDLVSLVYNKKKYIPEREKLIRRMVELGVTPEEYKIAYDKTTDSGM